VRLSPNLDGVTGSETLRISALAAQLSARGTRVVSLSAGEPDFATPDHVRAAGARAIAEGRTRYTPNAGIPALREAIAEKLGRENAVDYAPDEVLVSAGAKQVLFNACLALFGPGDEVLVPAPYWVSYPAMVRLARATPVPISTGRGEGYKLSAGRLAASLTPRTRGLILNSPANPTGAVYDERELAELAGLCLERNLWILSDEIYERLCYERPRAPSIAALGPEVRARTVTVNGFSKCFAMTGWRLGYGAAPREVVRALDVVQSHSTSNASSVSQYAGLAALTEREASERAVEAMRRAFHARRDRMVAALAGLPGVAGVPPAGAFYLWSDVSEAATRLCDGVERAAHPGGRPGLSDDFCARLLERHGLALVPGSAFGLEGHVRWSFAASEDEIDEGVARFREALGAREP
jgi:aspartate aminotransferase